MIKMFVDILDGVESSSLPSTLGQSLTFQYYVKLWSYKANQKLKNNIWKEKRKGY